MTLHQPVENFEEKKLGGRKCLTMASHTGEIQQLLVAEKKAAERVTEAKKRKAKRLKQAKDEAQVSPF
jgi:hypothetical protein